MRSILTESVVYILFGITIIFTDAAILSGKKKALNSTANDDYAPSKKVYGTIFNKKCNCTQAIKDYVNSENGQEDRYEEEEGVQPASYSRARRPYVKPKSSYNTDEEEEDPYVDGPTTGKPKLTYWSATKKSRQMINSTGYEDEEDEHFTGYSNSPPKKNSSRYQTSRTKKPTQFEEEVLYEEELTTRKSRQPYRSTTAKYRQLKNSTGYEDEEEYSMEYSDYSPKKKPSGYRRPPSKKPVKDVQYEEEETYEPKKNQRANYADSVIVEANEEDEEGDYQVYKALKKPPANTRRRVPLKKKAAADAYEDMEENNEEDWGYEKPSHKKTPATKRYTKRTTKKPMSSYQDEEEAGEEESPAPYKSKIHRTTVSRKSYPMTTKSYSEEGYTTPNVQYPEEQPRSYKKLNYNDDTAPGESKPKVKYEEPVGYVTSTHRPQHKTTAYHQKTAASAPAYNQNEEAPVHDTNNADIDNYLKANNTAKIAPRIVTVHQNASRETGILIKLVDRKKVVSPAYQKLY